MAVHKTRCQCPMSQNARSCHGWQRLSAVADGLVLLDAVRTGQQRHRCSAPHPYKSTSCQFGRRPFAPLGYASCCTCCCWDVRFKGQEHNEGVCASCKPERPSPAPDRAGSSTEGRRLNAPALGTNNLQQCCCYSHLDSDIRRTHLHETASLQRAHSLWCRNLVFC